MKILGIYRSKAKDISYKKRTIKSGILKTEVTGKVRIGKKSIEDDVQVDRKHHGGEFKAVYSYASEFYSMWKTKLDKPDLSYGIFGENISTQGLDESTVCIGDLYKFGDAILQAVQPRFPCRALTMVLQSDQIMKEFIDRKNTGIYWRVEKEGYISKNDEIELIEKNPMNILVGEIFPVLAGNRDLNTLKRLREAPVIEPSWAEKLDQYILETDQTN